MPTSPLDRAPDSVGVVDSLAPVIYLITVVATGDKDISLYVGMASTCH